MQIGLNQNRNQPIMEGIKLKMYYSNLGGLWKRFHNLSLAVESSPKWPFWIAIILLILVKLLFVTGNSVQMVYSPHDDGLYVSRAFHLLLDGGLGPYDGRLLVKQPGISLWLAVNRLFGVPYLLSINLLYALAGVYFLNALMIQKVSQYLLVLIFGLYLFNPVTIDHQWFRVMREPLSISLLVLMLGSLLYILIYLDRNKFSIKHLLILSISFSFALLVREEDSLLYGLLILFIGVAAWKLWSIFRLLNRLKQFAALFLFCLPFMTALATNSAMRLYVERYYGAPLLHDFGEGEFPKLIAAIRSVESTKDNRHVMVTQEALGKIRAAVPILAPVIDRLPRPSEKSYSCERFKVCSEWTNGWQLFWIKDAAFQAGLTPTLPAAQAYFNKARMEIEDACRKGKLACRNKGGGLLPTFEIRWTRALLQEMLGILKMMTMPGIGIVPIPPPTFPVDVDYGRMYQVVTMTHHYDSQLQAENNAETWKNQPQNLYLSLKYWLRYPDIAINNDFGPQAGGSVTGAEVHYQRHGRHEGRLWQDVKSKDSSALQLISPIESWKARILVMYEKFGLVLELLGMLAFLVRIFIWRVCPLSPLVWIVLIFTVFTGLRLLALSYVSVYMGGLDMRLFFSTYVIAILIAPLIIIDLFSILLKRQNLFHLNKGGN